MKPILCFLWILVFYLSSFAQQGGNTFSAQPEIFTKEIVQLLSNTKREDATSVAKKFSELIKSNKIDAASLETIIQTSQNLQKEKMRAYPHFFLYFSAINLIFNESKNTIHFSGWQEIVDGIIFEQKSGNFKDFMSFMEFSIGLFEKNAIYNSSAKWWHASATDFQWSFKNKKPQLIFPAQTIIAYSNLDTQKIENTSGIIFPLENKWQGKGGKIDWSRAGLPDVYAEIISPYTIQLDKSEINIDTVFFVHKQLFERILKGSFQDKIMSQQSNRSYPRFSSYDKNVKISDIGPNITFSGGFRMEGNNIYGSGDEIQPASIVFANDNGKKVITAYSSQFLIKKGEELSAQRAQVILTLAEDSITHPGVRMIYRFKDKELFLYREKSGIGSAPFYDSYHKKEIETDAIVWKINQPKIDLKMTSGGDKNAMEITSDNYYQKGEIEKYQTIKDLSPIHLLKRFADESQSNEFLAESFAKRMDPGYSENTIKNLLYIMMQDGFIFYDSERGLITVNEKTANYVMAASGKKDYDIIKINSFSNETNAQIDVDNREMSVAGVAMITLSDTANVYIFPKEKGVTIKDKQDMDFSGTVFAGRIDFEGTGFYFDYDSFKIDMTELAAATINIPNGKVDKQGSPEFVPMKSKIEGLTGFLNVDHPKNKSGKQRIEKFPIFTNRKTSFVYYDKKEVRDSTYLRDKFYFEIEPFSFDSLNSFDPYLADLKGKLVSAGIFPDFQENITVQEDLSWGFQRTTPAKGLDLYGGKGTYQDSILLSNNGLLGRGFVKHLFIEFNSNDILFAPDSLNAISDTFLMKKDKIGKASFPIVKGQDNLIHWLPYQDSMFINIQEKPLLMYEDEAALRGGLVFTQKGLTGNGKFEFTEAVLESELYRFSADLLESDTMSMEIKSIGGDQVTFKTPNVRGHVDFAKRIGEFKANLEDIPTEFSNNAFKTNINEFFWDMDKKILDFKSPEGSEGSYFVSTHPQKDSLRFMAKRGIFYMENSIIKAEEVSRFFVADAEIQPDSGKLTILPGGDIDTLRKAVLIADTTHRYHRIYDATLYVKSQHFYEGTGKYDYRYGNMEKIINLTKILVTEDKVSRKKKSYTTQAEGLIEEKDSFKIHPNIDFKGLASFSAPDTGITFDGFAKMKIGDSNTDWFSFKDKIDPNHFVLHYDKPLSPNGDTLTAGFSYGFVDTAGRPGLYPRLMTPKKDKADFDIITTQGILKHDAESGIFGFGSEEKLLKSSPKGNVLYYYEKENFAKAEGKIDLGLQVNPISIFATGSITHLVDSGKTTLQLLLGMNLPLDKILMTQLGNDVSGFSFDRPEVNVNNVDFENAYAEIFSKKSYKNKLDEFRKTGSFPLPKEMQSNIIFSHLTLVFDTNFQIYRSVGPIGIAYIGEIPIMKMINGYVEFGQRKFNDFFHIYLESSFNDWVYINYQNNTLMAVSSKEEFNKLLASIPNAKRQIPLSKDKKVIFLYTIGSAGAKESYVYRARMIAEAKFGAGNSDEKDEQFYINQELEEIKKQLLLDEQTLPDNVELDAEPPLLFDLPIEDTEEPPMNNVSPDEIESEEPPMNNVSPEQKNMNEEIKDKKSKKSKKDKKENLQNEPASENENLPTMIFEKPESQEKTKEPLIEKPIQKEPKILNEVKEEPPIINNQSDLEEPPLLTPEEEQLLEKMSKKKKKKNE